LNSRKIASLDLSRSQADAAKPAQESMPGFMAWLVRKIDLDTRRTQLQRYGTALAAVAVATVVRFLVDDLMGGRATYAFYLIATAFVAWRCGLGPALVAAGIGSLLGNFLFETPGGRFSLDWGPSQASFFVSLAIGVVTAFFCESLRVTARENARMYREARQSDERKDVFLAMLGHELRNPMAPLRNALYLLETMGPHDREVEQMHRLISGQVDQLIRLIDDLLDVSRITQEKIELKVESVELHSIVDATLNTVRPYINERRHDLLITLPTERVYLEADPVRMTQVLTNLLNNAAKYTEPGGRIWFTAEAEKGTLTLRVRDTGIGMSAEERERVFDLFEQGGDTVKQAKGGLGIGLTLVRSLVRLHGGTVEAESPGVGLGTEFIVRLPTTYGPRDAPSQTPPVAAPIRAPVPKNGGRMRVLVIDDVVATASGMAAMLGLWNYEAKTCHDAFSALELVRTFKPDVVLADIGLPQMNGYQLAAEMRRIPSLKEAVIVAVSGYGQESDRQKSKAAGFDRHLTKPVDPAELESLLADIRARRDEFAGVADGP
jgi:signal transduction histidine kinase/ActR/RegA family two-component response regulator